MNMQLFTIGHSNLALEDFIALLRRHEIKTLVDIRRFPGSRKYPHFGQSALSEAIAEHGISYRWLESLGGRRSKGSSEPSPNRGLRNQSFRNYADYMSTGEFREGMEQLGRIAEAQRTAIMCSESVFWRCHRRLVSDYVVAGGGTVHHIFPAGEAKPHSLTPEARITKAGVIYPDPAAADTDELSD